MKDLAAVCRTFQVGVAMHSGAEFGVELAAMIHTASTIPRCTWPAARIIGGRHHRRRQAAVRGRGDPGSRRAGIRSRVDEEKMARYEKYYEQHGITTPVSTKIRGLGCANVGGR